MIYEGKIEQLAEKWEAQAKQLEERADGCWNTDGDKYYGEAEALERCAEQLRELVKETKR